MGSKRSEGQAIDVTLPGAASPGGVTKGELYRINKWNGIAMSTVLPTDPETGFALECEFADWWVTIPAALSGAVVGDTLWWSATEGFKRGSTDLVAAGTAGAIGPACKVTVAPDANNVAAVRPLNAT